jgi:hypothetical protein
VSESTELTVAEQPQQLITIEPTKYVELVFEPFAKRLADAKTLAEAAEFDVTTTAGMAVAVKHRAAFRDIRVASEKARKERKAPILEIGKLLDSRQKEIEAEIEPFESRFDAAIKAEEKRKDDEKIAKAVAESARITAIRKRIAETQTIPSMLVGKSSETIAAAIESLETVEITLEDWAEFCGEAEMAKIAAAQKLGEMLSAQIAHEAEQARLAAEREAIERQRAELAEQERLAAVARAEREAKDRAERERVEAEQRAAREHEEARLRAEREAAAAKLQADREAAEAELRKQREEIVHQQAEINAVKAEQARAERERQEAIEEEARTKREAEEAAAMAEAARIQAEKDAAEAERIRREHVEFEKNGPEADDIVAVLADYYSVGPDVARAWLGRHMWALMEKAA